MDSRHPDAPRFNDCKRHAELAKPQSQWRPAFTWFALSLTNLLNERGQDFLSALSRFASEGFGSVVRKTITPQVETGRPVRVVEALTSAVSECGIALRPLARNQHCLRAAILQNGDSI
jgi:hypothetical protein